MSETIVKVNVNIGELATEAVNKLCKNVKVFNVVESFLRNGHITQLMSVSQLLPETSSSPMYLTAEFDAITFQKISERQTIDVIDYYDILTTKSMSSVESKFLVQFEYNNVLLQFESVENLTLMKFETDDKSAVIDSFFRAFKTAKMVEEMTAVNAESVFYSHALSSGL